MIFSAFATFILQSTLILALALALRSILRERIAAASRYRMIFVITACLPFLAAASIFEVRPSALPAATEQRSFDARAFSSDAASMPPEPAPRTFRIRVPEKTAEFLLVVWVVVGLFLAWRSLSARGSMAFALRRMKLCRDPAWLDALDCAATRHGMRRRVTLLEGGGRPPFTAGFLGRTIVVPTADGSWNAEQRKAVLLHELAHVKRRDLLGMTYVELIAAAAWCVPFMAYAIKALIEDREEACDEAAIEKGARPSDYAAIVLELTAAHPLPTLRGALGMVARTRTEARIERITNRDGRKIENRYLARAALVALLLVGFSICGTGMLSRVFALESTGTVEIRSISPDGQPSLNEYPLSALPTASPLVGPWKVTQPFGKQTNPVSGSPYMHVGIDLANGRSGDGVHTTIAGTVLQAGYDERNGNYVVIGKDRLRVRFSKLQDIGVALEDRVRIGEGIGTVGATGIATGPHLHYEVWFEGSAVDPAVLLKAGGAVFVGLDAE